MTATYTFRPAWRSSHGGEREHAHVTSLRRQRRNARNWLPASAKGGTYPRRAYFLADELAQVHEPILPLVHVFTDKLILRTASAADNIMVHSNWVRMRRDEP